MNQERQLVRGHRVILLLDYEYYCTNPIKSRAIAFSPLTFAKNTPTSPLI